MTWHLPPKGNKFGAKKVTLDGYTFDSTKESRHYAELKLRERAGEITDLVVKPVYLITVNGQPVKMRNGQMAKYTGDFGYKEAGETVCIDVKGYHISPDYRLRRALVEAIYGIRIREV